MAESLQRKVAVVTGGGTGIGRSVCRLLAQRQAAVVVVYSRSRREAEEAVDEARSGGGEAIAIEADIADERAVKTMIDIAVSTYGGLHYLVNNAGITRQLRFDDLDAISGEVWDELFAVNVKGTFNCSKHAAPHLRLNPGAAIVNVGSIAGETGYGSSLPYAVSKSAVHGMTRSLARALAPDIRVNCVAPGAVETRWWAGHEAKMRALSGQLPLQRISTPEDIARLVLTLLQAESVTGQVLRAENGQTL